MHILDWAIAERQCHERFGLVGCSRPILWELLLILFIRRYSTAAERNLRQASVACFRIPLLQFNSQSRDRCSGHGFRMVSMVSVSPEFWIYGVETVETGETVDIKEVQ
jgi:hypothetical protein